MKVWANLHTHVEIDDSEQYDITMAFLRKTFDIQENTYINKKNNLIHWWEESMGSHSSVEEEVVRRATINDRLFFKIIEAIEEIRINNAAPIEYKDV
jgi:penicillin-binding protein-related factor A (putative recombinase)